MTHHGSRNSAGLRAARVDLTLLVAVALLTSLLALSACGTAAPHRTSSSSGVAEPVAAHLNEPNAVIVQIGGYTITKAMFAHAFSVAVKLQASQAPAPTPPDFTACIKYLESSTGLPGSGGQKPSEAELKGKCQQRYQDLVTRALEPLIIDRWVMGGAAEEGVNVGPTELQRAISHANAGQSPAEVSRILARSGRTPVDFILQTKIHLLEEGIRHVLSEKTAHITPQQVAAYYEENKSLFGRPPRRALEIARLGSRAEALTLKREIAHGESFATAVSKLPLQQPIFSKNGSVPEYQHLLYHQIPLDHAIFSARRGALSGPVRINYGYYIFRVKRVFPPAQKTLAQARATIVRELPEVLYKQALATYIKHWRESWTQKTDCKPGYVIKKCRQFTAPAKRGAIPESLYTFT